MYIHYMNPITLAPCIQKLNLRYFAVLIFTDYCTIMEII